MSLRILMIDKYYYIKGGAERYVFELTKALEEAGHEVIPFAMSDPQNHETKWKDYFVPHVALVDEHTAKSLLDGLRYTARAIYSREAQRRLRRLIEVARPDIAHLHMIDHQISPSILPVLRKAGIPSLQTVHQFKNVCPNYRLYNERTATLCEKCVGRSTIHAMLSRCHKGSFLASTAISVETGIHRLFGLDKMVDRWHTPSAFVAKKLIQGGFPQDRIETFPYVLNIEDYPFESEPGQEIVYGGRFSHEKGLETLLEASASRPDIPLALIGDGPLRPDLEELARRRSLHHIRFTGWLEGEALKERVANAAALVVPSEWYENSPLVIYEALSSGTPILGAEIGGIPELIDPGKTGFLFRAGDPQDLADKLPLFFGADDERRAMRSACRAQAEQSFSRHVHIERLEACYARLRGSR